MLMAHLKRALSCHVHLHACLPARLQGIRASILIGILFVTFISWIPNHEATYFRDRSSIPGGHERYVFFRKVRAALRLQAGVAGARACLHLCMFRRMCTCEGALCRAMRVCVHVAG